MRARTHAVLYGDGREQIEHILGGDVREYLLLVHGDPLQTRDKDDRKRTRVCTCAANAADSIRLCKCCVHARAQVR